MATSGLDPVGLVRQRIEENQATTRLLLEGGVVDAVATVAQRIIDAYRAGNKVIFFGNGGSAADAQHLAAEMCGRFLIDRRSLPALALADNIAAVTAIGNDYAFEDVFARQMQGFGAPGDVAVGISTSGQSENVVRAMQVARANGLCTVALTGGSGGRLAQVAELCLLMPSAETPRIQEGHALIGHILCELVESTLFASDT
jgi:D-sedoheptulose 7-phosphate isomerase